MVVSEASALASRLLIAANTTAINNILDKSTAPLHVLPRIDEEVHHQALLAVLDGPAAERAGMWEPLRTAAWQAFGPALPLPALAPMPFLGALLWGPPPPPPVRCAMQT